MRCARIVCINNAEDAGIPRRTLKLLAGLGVAAASLVFLTGAGCAEVVAVRIIQPAELTLPGIRTVAVGGFETVHAADYIYEETDGRLRGVSPADNPSKEAAAQVRAGLKDALSATPHFALVDVADFDRILGSADLMQMVREVGLRRTGVDAVVFGRVWASTIEVGGFETEKVTLEHIDYRNGKKPIEVRDETVSFPYRMIGGVLVVEYSFVRLEPHIETIAVDTVVRSFSRKVGGVTDLRDGERPSGIFEGLLTDALSSVLGASDGGRSRTAGENLFDLTEQLVPDLSAVIGQLSLDIAGSFVRRVTPTEVASGIPLAEGDIGVRNLILAGAFDHAERRLLELLGDTKKDIEASERAANLYNLGVCLEARGPHHYLTASGYYLKALYLDPENGMFAAGVGRVSQKIEDDRVLREQRRHAAEGEMKP